MTARVQAREVGVRFFFDRQSRPVTPALARLRRRCTSGWGLRNVSFSMYPSECIALIGPNGAGKTTLLRVLAGVYRPDAGRLELDGRVGSLLSIEGGVNPALTGRENALLLAVLAGMSRHQAREALTSISSRSELGAAFDHPVSSYSQGMRARLGFSVVEHVSPEILLLDEVHEALDADFRSHVEQTVADVLANGGTVVAAGHDHDLLQRICGRAFLIEDGLITDDGPFEHVVERYNSPRAFTGQVMNAEK